MSVRKKTAFSWAKTWNLQTLFFLKRAPARLLLVSTGNIANKEIETLFLTHLPKIAEAFDSSRVQWSWIDLVSVDPRLILGVSVLFV